MEVNLRTSQFTFSEHRRSNTPHDVIQTDWLIYFHCAAYFLLFFLFCMTPYSVIMFRGLLWSKTFIKKTQWWLKYKPPPWTSLNKRAWRSWYLPPNKCNATQNKGDQNKYRPLLTLPKLSRSDWYRESRFGTHTQVDTHTLWTVDAVSYRLLLFTFFSMFLKELMLRINVTFFKTQSSFCKFVMSL